MAKTIVQRVAFKDTSAAILYNTYMNGKEHSAATGVAAKISDREGENFVAHNGYVKGRNLRLIRNKLIVQSWRASDWKKSDYESTFVLLFEQNGNNGVVNMVHANVPDSEFLDLKKGWNEYYWKPWKKYFAKKKK